MTEQPRHATDKRLAGYYLLMDKCKGVLEEQILQECLFSPDDACVVVCSASAFVGQTLPGHIKMDCCVKGCCMAFG